MQLQRVFPHRVWSIDITYIPMPHGHMYLTAIFDWFSRRLVGHYLSDSLEAEAVIHAVKETVKACGVPVIINSDQGSHNLQVMTRKNCFADSTSVKAWMAGVAELII